jgi:protein TonB
MKISKAPLERKRPLFFTAGLVFALSVTLVSFEWRTPCEISTVPFGATETPDAPQGEIITLPPPKKTVEKPKLPDLEPKKKTLEIKIVPNETLVEAKEIEPLIPAFLDDLISGDMKSDESDVDEPMTPFKIVEKMPAYPGGDSALLTYLAGHTEYPRLAIENNITGVVYVTYVVDKDGNITKVEIARGVHPSLDNEALRVVKTITGYKPGMQRGKAVPVEFTIPIRFTLDG